LVAFVLSVAFGPGVVAYAAVDHIHWGSTNTPLDGLTVSWRSSDTSSKIRWGYTTSYEKGTFDGARRSDTERYLYDYSFSAPQPSSTIHYQISDGGGWTGDKTFRTSVNTSSTRFT
jgi:hypothetical protein